MDNFFNEKDYELLKNDRYTFSVMARIMKLDCELRLSDHEKIIVCFTGQPFPARKREFCNGWQAQIQHQV